MAEKKNYIVFAKCYHEKKLYHKGDVVTFSANEVVPHHFKLVGTVEPPAESIGKPVKVNRKDTVAQ
jgi:uncharacterized cupin superfamily protein